MTRKTDPLEANTERKLCRRVDNAGGRALKLPAVLYRGCPDRLVLLPQGKLYFVELKRKSGVSGIHQDRFRSFLRSLGFPCDTIYGDDQLEEWLRDKGI